MQRRSRSGDEWRRDVAAPHSSFQPNSRAGSGKNGARAAAAPEHQLPNGFHAGRTGVSASPGGRPEIRELRCRHIAGSVGTGAIFAAMAQAQDTRVRRGGGRRRRRRPAAALVAAIGGFRTILFAPPARFPAGRTAALMQGSIDLLSDLDVWPALAHHAAPLRAIRLDRRDAPADPRAGGHVLCLGDRPAGLRLQHPERRPRRCAAAGMPERSRSLRSLPEPVDAIEHGEDTRRPSKR